MGSAEGDNVARQLFSTPTERGGFENQLFHLTNSAVYSRPLDQRPELGVRFPGSRGWFLLPAMSPKMVMALFWGPVSPVIKWG